MNSWVLRLGLALSLVVAGIAGWAAWQHAVPEAERHGPYFIGDRVQQAIDGIADDRIHVTEDGRHLLSPEAERRLAAQLAEVRGADVAVVVWAPASEAGYPVAGTAARQIRDSLGDDGVVVVWEGPEQGHLELPPNSYLQEPETYGSIDLAFEGDPERRISEFLAEIGPGALESYDDEGGSGPAPLWLIVLLVVATILLAAPALAAVAYGAIMIGVGVVRSVIGLPFYAPGPFWTKERKQ